MYTIHFEQYYIFMQYFTETFFRFYVNSIVQYDHLIAAEAIT